MSTWCYADNFMIRMGKKSIKLYKRAWQRPTATMPQRCRNIITTWTYTTHLSHRKSSHESNLAPSITAPVTPVIKRLCNLKRFVYILRAHPCNYFLKYVWGLLTKKKAQSDLFSDWLQYIKRGLEDLKLNFSVIDTLIKCLWMASKPRWHSG